MIKSNFRVFALLNSFTEGKSGGDTAFIEIFKRLDFKNLSVVTSFLGQKLCESCGLSAHYFVTTNEKHFANVYFTYLKRIVVCLFYLLKKNNIDLIYSSSDALPDIFPAFLYKLLNKKTKWVVKRYHNIPKARFVSYVSQRVSILLAKKADLVIQTGKFGFDYDFIFKVLPSKQSFDAVFVSRLHLSKGIFDLIKIWRLVLKSKPSARLGIIGTGSAKIISELEKSMRKEGIEKSVTFLGFLSEKEKIASLKNSKIFLFPSHEESFGLVLGEAMLCKVPIIAYALPDLKWCLRFVNFVPCYNFNYFAKVVVRLLNDYSLRKKKVLRAYEFAKNFTWKKASEFEKKQFQKLFEFF